MKKLIIVLLLAGCGINDSEPEKECRANVYIIEHEFATTLLPVKVLESTCNLPEMIDVNFSDVIRKSEKLPPRAKIRFGLTLRREGINYYAESIGDEFHDLY